MSPTSHWYNTVGSNAEQNLIEDCVNEAVRIHGLDFFYVARDLVAFDKVLGEDAQSSYSSSWLIAGYLKNVMGYAGGGELMSKFGGLEIKDQIIVSIPVREFDNEIGLDSGFVRPREGDLLFFPLHKKAFQISFVNQLEFFYPLGRIMTYECTAELFTYSGETFNTGIDDIDLLQTNFSLNVFDWALKDENSIPLIDENGDYLVVDEFTTVGVDPLSDNSEFNTELPGFLDFSEEDPFSDMPHRRI